MDTSLLGGVPSQVPLQVEAWVVPEIIPGKQGAVGGAEVHTGGVLNSEGGNETVQVKLRTTYGGSNVPASMSKEGISESRLFAPPILVPPKVLNLQQSTAIGGDVNHGQVGPSKEKRPEENGASKGVGERDFTLDSHKLVAKESTQVRTEVRNLLKAVNKRSKQAAIGVIHSYNFFSLGGRLTSRRGQGLGTCQCYLICETCTQTPICVPCSKYCDVNL